MFGKVVQFGCLSTVAAALWITTVGTAQDKSNEKKASNAKTADPGKKSAGALGPEAEKAFQNFEKVLGDWKQIIKKMRTLRTRFQAAEEADLPEIQKEWDAMIARGEDLIPRLRESCKAAYLAAPNQDREVIGFMVKVLDDDIKRDNYEPAIDVAQTLIENNAGIKELYEMAGVAAFATNDFATAERYLKEADTAGVLTDNNRKYLEVVGEYKDLWKKEAEIRKNEAAAGDLPRVRLETSKGEIILELFENEAPATVGNFINLIKEKKFYDNLTFHRVLGGFMAQGGCPKGDGTGGPGYNIKCECYADNARMHFRGSLSMAKAAARDTGGSQFFR